MALQCSHAPMAPRNVAKRGVTAVARACSAECVSCDSVYHMLTKSAAFPHLHVHVPM